MVTKLACSVYGYKAVRSFHSIFLVENTKLVPLTLTVNCCLSDHALDG